MDVARSRGSEDLRHSRHLEAGEVLFRQGEIGELAYVIEAGVVEIYAEHRDGPRTIARLGPNDIFGEMALFGDTARTASAMAVEPTRLLPLSAEQLRERLDAADPLTRHLLHLVVRRCKDLLSRLRGGGSVAPPAAVQGSEAEAEDRSLALGRLRIEQDIQRALTDGEFQLHFQPILRFSDGRTAGFEALIRWQRPDGSRVSPGEFIPVAEQSELICDIGLWVLEQAVDALLQLEDLRARQAPLDEPLFMNVNLSARQLSDARLVPAMASQVARLEGRRCRIKLEVTESLMIGNVAAMQAFIGQCRALGVQVVLDDFGTGYCSLSYLHLFEVQTMKLDRSFIRGMAVSDASEKVVRGVVGIAHDLGLDIVAEGIETADQAEQSRRLGIDYAQGFYFARPAPLSEVARRLVE